MCCRSLAVKIFRLRLIRSSGGGKEDHHHWTWSRWSLGLVNIFSSIPRTNCRKETLQAVHRALPGLCIQVCLDIHTTPKSVAEVGVMMMLMMDTRDYFKTF